MSKKKGHGGGDFEKGVDMGVKAARYLVGYLKRFFPNLWKNISWIFTNGRTANNKFDTFFNSLFTTPPNPAILTIGKPVVLEIIIFFLWKFMILKLALTVLIGWTAFESI